MHHSMGTSQPAECLATPPIDQFQHFPGGVQAVLLNPLQTRSRIGIVSYSTRSYNLRLNWQWYRDCNRKKSDFHAVQKSTFAAGMRRHIAKYCSRVATRCSWATPAQHSLCSPMFGMDHIWITCLITSKDPLRRRPSSKGPLHTIS